MPLINDQDNKELAQKALMECTNCLAPERNNLPEIHQNLSYEEVSEIMNINYRAVCNRVCQSIKVLKKIITIQLIFILFFADVNIPDTSPLQIR